MRASRIGDLLGNSLRRLGVERNVEAAQVVEMTNNILRELFGDERLRDVRARSFVRGEIRIEFAHTMAVTEVRYRTTEILELLRQRLPRAKVERVRFTTITDRP